MYENFAEFPKHRHRLNDGVQEFKHVDDPAQEAELTPDEDGWVDLCRSLFDEKAPAEAVAVTAPAPKRQPAKSRGPIRIE